MGPFELTLSHLLLIGFGFALLGVESTGALSLSTRTSKAVLTGGPPCRFDHSGLLFDICPLLNIPVHLVELSLPSASRIPSDSSILRLEEDAGKAVEGTEGSPSRDTTTRVCPILHWSAMAGCGANPTPYPHCPQLAFAN